MKTYYEHEAPKNAAGLIRVERNTLNPLPGRTFVSIAYYRDCTGETYAVVF